MRYIEKAKRNEALLFPEYLDDYVELMWLTGKLMPDFRTLSDFRKGTFRTAWGRTIVRGVYYEKQEPAQNVL